MQLKVVVARGLQKGIITIIIILFIHFLITYLNHNIYYSRECVNTYAQSSYLHDLCPDYDWPTTNVGCFWRKQTSLKKSRYDPNAPLQCNSLNRCEKVRLFSSHPSILLLIE